MCKLTFEALDFLVGVAVRQQFCLIGCLKKDFQRLLQTFVLRGGFPFSLLS